MLYFIFGFLGVFFFVMGLITLKYPDWGFKYSLSRMLYLKNGEPTEFYYTTAKISAVIYLIAGAGLFIWAVVSGISHKDGFTIYVDKQEINLPCNYDDFADIGFTLCDGEDLNAQMTQDEKTIRLKNSKGKIIKVTFKNIDGTATTIGECEIYRVSASYQTQNFEATYNGGDPLNSSSYYVTYATTDVDEGPEISLPNGFNTGMNKNSVNTALGSDNYTGNLGTSNAYLIKQGFEHATVRVNFNSYGTEISSVSIECEDF